MCRLCAYVLLQLLTICIFGLGSKVHRYKGRIIIVNDWGFRRGFTSTVSHGWEQRTSNKNDSEDHVETSPQMKFHIRWTINQQRARGASSWTDLTGVSSVGFKLQGHVLFKKCFFTDICITCQIYYNWLHRTTALFWSIHTINLLGNNYINILSETEHTARCTATGTELHSTLDNWIFNPHFTRKTTAPCTS